jgi:hypothetical protein
LDSGELVAVLRSWTGRAVTVLGEPVEGDAGAERMTGTLIEGYPEETTRFRSPGDWNYEPNEYYALFTITRDAVDASRFPVGVTYPVHRNHATARWDPGREGKALWVSITTGHTSLWIVEDEGGLTPPPLSRQ